METYSPGTPYQTRTATIVLREDGIVSVSIAPNCIQTLEDANENLTLANAVRGGIRRPILVDISVCDPLTPELRHFYSGKKLGVSFIALAIKIAPTPFGEMVGNIYLRIASPGVPIQLFSDSSAAIQWLLKYIQ